MRERKKPEQSFITIEVRKNKLEQAMFKYNKPVTREHRAEFNFIKQWCRQKGIVYSVVQAKGYYNERYVSEEQKASFLHGQGKKELK